MNEMILSEIAQKIVETIYHVCGHHANYISPDGIIIASIDQNRVHAFHEIGKKSALEKKTIEVTDDNYYLGTYRGINVPLIHNEKAIAVIGITGDPDVVRNYADTAKIIAYHFVDKQDLCTKEKLKSFRSYYILTSLLEGKEVDLNIYDLFVEDYGIIADDLFRLMLVSINIQIGQLDSQSSLHAIHVLFSEIPIKIFTFNYANQYIAVIREQDWQERRTLIKDFINSHVNTIDIAVGMKYHFLDLRRSEIKTDAVSGTINSDDLAVTNNMDFNIIVESVSSEVRRSFAKKTISNLSAEEIKLLTVYFNSDLSLKKTCELLYYHKNTIQYKLRKIYDETGYDPRLFHDASVLYLALTMYQLDK